MIESALQQYVTADPTVAGLIATRLYPLLWPDEPMFPLATYQLISTVTDSVLSGPLSATTCRVQYDSWAKTYAEAKQLAAAITAVLEGFTGGLPGGPQVLDLTLDSCFDLYDEPSATYRVTSDFLVTFLR